MKQFRRMLALSILAAATCWATGQDSPDAAPPKYKYPITPQVGPYVIVAHSFQGGNSREMAEELATFLRTEWKVPCYLHDWGYKQRLEQDQAIAADRERIAKAMKNIQGEVVGAPRIKSVRIQDQYAVLIGGFRDMDGGREYLEKLRKMPPLPEKFCNKKLVTDEKGVGYLFINPFKTAMVVPNPVAPKKEDEFQDPRKLEPFIKQLNEGEPNSVLKLSKDWTLVVKLYKGQTAVQSDASGSLLRKIGFASSDDYLNASAKQAQETARFLRSIKIDGRNPYEATVMHHRTYSMVCVGNFDSPTDPQLIAMAKTLSGMKLTDSQRNIVLDQLNEQPLPMEIPR